MQEMPEFIEAVEEQAVNDNDNWKCRPVSVFDIYQEEIDQKLRCKR